ncbi:ABC-type glycerol-3-phosphate transport system permease component [Arthrobacter sp. CAN_A214]|uniref:carbohydrate ABC transporter permease n=1 Tax=Arthrobacter sp. CAN_A214 TaxID=2787720 RepID=UPI001A362886
MNPHHGAAAGAAHAARLGTAVVVGLVMMFPLYWMITLAFSPNVDVFSRELNLWPSSWTLDNFRRIFTSFPTALWFGNSVAITSIVTLLTVTVNLLAGYAFAKLTFRGKGVIFLLVLSTMMIPVQVLMVAQFRLVTELGIYGTFWAVILPAAASAFGIFLARQFIIAIPDELMEAENGRRRQRPDLSPDRPPALQTLDRGAGAADGDVPVERFRLAADRAEGQRAFHPADRADLPAGQYGADCGSIMALALISILPIVLMFLLFWKYFVQGLARSGIR